MQEYLEQLNDAQLAPVLQKDGAMIVIAGAGSGKTRVLTYRIAYLMSQGVQHGLAEWGYQPALLDIQPHAERQIENNANTPVKAASEIGSLTGKAGSLDAHGRNRFELNGAHG